MKLIKVNPNNEQYYSKEFIRGFNLGAERQFEADKADTPQGEWVVKDGVFYCSCCDNDSAGLSEDDVNVYGIPLPNYCQDCGARMKGADDE